MDLSKFIFDEMENGYRLRKYLGDQTHVTVPGEFQGRFVVQIGKESFSAEKNPSCTAIETIILPLSVQKIEIHSFCGCTALTKIVCENRDIEISKKPLFYSPNLVDCPIFIWEKLNMTPEQTGNMLKYRISQWEDLEQCEVEQSLSYVSKRKDLLNYLFEESETALLFFLLNEGVHLSLSYLKKQIEKSIQKGFVEKTAFLLEYQHKNYSKEEISRFQENLELVELGMEAPTLSQFKEKWSCKRSKNGLYVFGYKGNNTFEVIPSVLADGTRILGVMESKVANFWPLKQLKLEEGILSVKENAFSSCNTLEEVFLPQSLEVMEIKAFFMCTGLKSITIPPKIKKIPNCCFYHCDSLEEVTLQEGLLSLGAFAFSGCSSLKTIKLPQSLCELEEINQNHYRYMGGIFYGSGLQSIEIPPKITVIPEFCFGKCLELEEVILHENITKLSAGSFYSVVKLQDEQGFLIINDILFSYFGDEKVCAVPKQVKRISSRAFEKRTCEEVILPEQLLEIDTKAFKECICLKKLYIPDFVKILPKYMVIDCPVFEKLEFSCDTFVEYEVVERNQQVHFVERT